MNICGNIKVSMIVPVYNGEKYLQECLQSICRQTLWEIEIIVIDDGSTDKSISIAGELAAGDGRIKIIQQANAGVSAARNKGLSVATGAWIAFADSDDWLEADMLEKMYAGATENDSDICICNVRLVSIKENSQRLTMKAGLTVFSGQEGIRNIMSFTYDYANWNKLYNRSIIAHNNLCFSPEMMVWEDLLFNLQYAAYTKNAFVIDQLLYNYRMHDNSVMATSQIKLIAEYNKLYSQYIFFAQTNELLKEMFAFRQAMAKSFYNHHLPMLIKTLKKNSSGRIAFIQKLTARLRDVHEGIFFFPKKPVKILQWLKQSLLQRRNFFLFSVLSVLINIFKKSRDL